MAIIHYFLSMSITWLTFYLSHKQKMGAVRASSLIALLSGVIYQIPQSFVHIPPEIPSIIIGSTFIGMITSRKHFKNFHLVVAPLFFVLFYTHLSKKFNHFGGALGTAACISLVITIFLRSLKVTKYIIAPFRRMKYVYSKRNKK